MLSESEFGPPRSEGAGVRPVRHIMVCDDDLAVRYAMKRMFMQELRAEVIEAENGLVALKALRESPVDLLILDINMPVVDGVEALQAIRSTPALARLPVIVLSGECDAETVKRVIDLGVTDYLSKPLSRPGTLERLKRITASLQVEAKSQPAHQTRSKGATLMAGHKLLVVDASEDFRYFIRTTFGTRFRIVEAANGIDALDIALGARPHAVMIGRDVPQMEADQLAQKLRKLKIREDLVLIAVAARAELDAIRECGLYDACVPRTFVPEVFAREFDALGPASVPLAELLELCPTLRAQMVSAAEQVFGMMLKMDVEPRDRVVIPFQPPYAVAKIGLAIGDRFSARFDLVADVTSANAFAVAMFGVPEPGEALGELSNIVAGRVKHALVNDHINVTLGLPDVSVVETGEVDARPHDSLGVRFGVTGSDYELEIRFSVSARNPIAADAASANKGLS